MKKYLFYFFMLVCLSFAACSKDDSGKNSDDNDTCTVKTEAISITVKGSSMSNIKGSAKILSDKISVDIAGKSSNNAIIFFSCPKVAGSYNLALTGPKGQTITAYDSSQSLNVILTTGCMKIVSIGDSTVVMRFNINEEDTKMNGEITLDVEK